MAAKRKNIFEDLGKATLRGVRKCPKCGTYNGTRGSSCKNKECKLTFKIVKTKVKDSDEVVAVRINCIGLQIFSVRLQEYGESTYNNRFFVRIPLIEGMETLQDEAEASMIMRSAAVCFAPACKKPTEDFSTITLNMNPCSHTLSVVNCTNEAKPLILKEALLSMLPISDAMKQDIYNLLKSDEESFLVQRLNKTTMVVKCMPDELHPVGFLHFYLYEPLKNARKYKILCECKVGVTKPFVPRERQLCMHYYMCICAFASDEKLTEEFKNLIHSVYMKSPAITTDDVFKCSLSEDFADLRDFFVDDICPPSKRKKNVLLDSNTLFFLSQNESDVSAKVDDDIPKHSINLTDGKPIYTFDEWLGSVVERINQTMHYKFDGHPDPLVFHVPQSFFNVLQQRLSEGSKKKRLPNSVTCYCRKDTLPFGIFSKYTWNITNIIQLKRIFYTPEIVLDVQRCFYEPREGMFVPLKEDRLDTAENSKKLNESAKSSEPKQKQIRPVELKTFLKVGQTALDQKEPTPFIVEWIPDILPQSHIGEMRLKFEYGHQRNGLIEHRTPVSKPATAS